MQTRAVIPPLPQDRPGHTASVCGFSSLLNIQQLTFQPQSIFSHQLQHLALPQSLGSHFLVGVHVKLPLTKHVLFPRFDEKKKLEVPCISDSAIRTHPTHMQRGFYLDALYNA